MGLGGGENGYGVVTKTLHWLTVVALVTQFVIGYTMDADSAADAADDRVDAFADRGERLAKARGEAAEERFEAEVERREEAVEALDDSPGAAELTDVVTGAAFDGGVTAVEAHVTLGITVLALGVARLAWRRATPLPPWAEHLNAGERRLESWLEKVLLALLLLVPASGLLLALAGGAWLPLHISAQIALLATVALHVGLVLKHTVVRRNRHLSRML